AVQDTSLIDILSLLSKESTKNTLRSWIEKGRVTIDGKVAKKANAMVMTGQEVCVGKRTKFIENEIGVIYEDNHLVVINKPEGLLSVATNFDKEATVHEILKRRYHSQRVFPVHRLDRETSGVMVFAYSEKARDHFKAKFYVHDIEREYLAIVEGNLDSTTGSWKSYLLEDERYMVKSTNSSQGKLSTTHYEVLGRNTRYSLLRLTLETGRKNQIRVHCREAGHPIVGDKKYGSSSDAANRLCLHAAKLGFTHPMTGKSLSFESTIPEVFFKMVKIKKFV
ncbi:MAG TPA: RluA family pseudouridine synthase, partial [Rhabdochlamydiaceae bacterium]|nr:RluA family pseudouridine synthase [Rhabdochlamydiaceae bacterium]